MKSKTLNDLIKSNDPQALEIIQKASPLKLQQRENAYSKTSPLEYACLYANEDAIFALIEKEIDFHEKNPQEGLTPLHYLVGGCTVDSRVPNTSEDIRKRQKILNRLHQTGKINFNIQDSYGQTAIRYLASKPENLINALVPALYECGTDINVIDKQNKTFYDVINERFHNTWNEFLNNLGARSSKDLKGISNITSLTNSEQENWETVNSSLSMTEKSNMEQDLMNALELGNLNFFNQTMSHNPDIYARVITKNKQLKIDTGDTLMHLAIQHWRNDTLHLNRTEIIHKLWSLGGSFNTRNHSAQSPLDQAKLELKQALLLSKHCFRFNDKQKKLSLSQHLLKEYPYLYEISNRVDQFIQAINSKDWDALSTMLPTEKNQPLTRTMRIIQSLGQKILN